LCDVGRVAVKHCFKLLSFLHLYYNVSREGIISRTVAEGENYSSEVYCVRCFIQSDAD